ncbi:DoxX [Trypanosoma rangeli]|uniref:DoxX n=1 Tax=Trypanosoma rangeli TaxID=5698 RepID=A0A422NY54_TRYRA|nr:DoxX [Trypanosoma rangeli]RNF10349.1 DoxX [Trypanosoma rangeli]|eukprot:RNF10349.1 DoxX [Trypanosoma rangeli]
MSFRSAIRYFGLILILIPFIAAGFQLISNPAVSAVLLAKSNFPKMLKMAGVEYRLSASDYAVLTQAFGALLLAFSLFILLGVGRCFFALLLVISTFVLTVAFHVNLDDPMKITDSDLFQLMKNVSIIGALLFVAGSGRLSHRYSMAYKEAEIGKKKR